MNRQHRINIINELIREIAGRGRKFFAYEDKVAEIVEKNGRLYYRNEFNNKDCYLHVPEYRNIKGFHHGGTLTALVKNFRDFIMTGYQEKNPAYGGLFCQHWGYPQEDMVAIQQKAIELGYIEQPKAINNK